MVGQTWVPRAMRVAPALPAVCRTVVQPHRALLVNPFYPKDPRASFGKHVLTPTALTSIAGATPAHWQVEYWDENLLQGPPPHAVVPQVVGITVHLTFARRAYELAGLVSCPGLRRRDGRPAHVVVSRRSGAACRRHGHR